jgi:Ulp1 family protease
MPVGLQKLRRQSDLELSSYRPNKKQQHSKEETAPFDSSSASFHRNNGFNASSSASLLRWQLFQPRRPPAAERRSWVLSSIHNSPKNRAATTVHGAPKFLSPYSRNHSPKHSFMNHKRSSSISKMGQTQSTESSKPTMDVYTLELVQKLVETWLYQTNPTITTLLALANMLLGSDAALELYASQEQVETNDTNNLNHHSGMWSFWRLPQAEDATTRRRYAWTNALNRLQQTDYATTTMISCWDEARTALLTVFVLPESDQGDDTNDTTQTTSKKTIQKDDSTEKVMESFIERLQQIKLDAATTPTVSQSSRAWRQVQLARSVQRADEIKRLEARKEADRLAELARRQQAQLEAAQEKEQQERRAQIRAQVLRPLTQVERDAMDAALHSSAGPDHSTLRVAKDDADNVIQRGSLRTLEPFQWLNDEIIHAYLDVLAHRDAQLTTAVPAHRKRNHFFKSFFVFTLRNEGNSDPALNGVYCYRNVKRWSKKVPGTYTFTDACCFCSAWFTIAF